MNIEQAIEYAKNEMEQWRVCAGIRPSVFAEAMAFEWKGVYDMLMKIDIPDCESCERIAAEPPEEDEGRD